MPPVPLKALAIVVAVVVVVGALVVFVLPMLTGSTCAGGICTAGTFVVTTTTGQTKVFGYGAPAGQFITINGQQVASISMYESFKATASGYTKFDVEGGMKVAIDVQQQFTTAQGSQAWRTLPGDLVSNLRNAATTGFNLGTWYDFGACVQGNINPPYPDPASVQLAATSNMIITFINAAGYGDGFYRLAAFAQLTAITEGAGTNPTSGFSSYTYYIQFTVTTGTVSLSVTGG